MSTLSVVLLIFGYAPRLYIRDEAPLGVVVLAPSCANPIKIRLGITFDTPSLWAMAARANVSVFDIEKCEKFWVFTSSPNAKLKLSSSEAVSYGDKREVSREIIARPDDKGGQVFEFEVRDLNQHWSVFIEGAFMAQRAGFDRYIARGALSLKQGDWKLEVKGSDEYNVSGDTDLTMRVVKEDRPEDRDLLFFSGISFYAIAEYKEVFAILVSTILGLALSAVMQGLAIRSGKRS